MIEFYKTFGTMTKKIDKPEKGCWISAIAPTQEECDYLIQEIGVLPEFVKASLDEEESSHIDHDEDEGQTIILMLMKMKIQMKIHCFIQPYHLVLSL